ncbi:MAG: hypothetical protein ACI30H_07665 [Paludibacteraceae bacterium]
MKRLSILCAGLILSVSIGMSANKTIEVDPFTFDIPDHPAWTWSNTDITSSTKLVMVQKNDANTLQQTLIIYSYDGFSSVDFLLSANINNNLFNGSTFSTIRDTIFDGHAAKIGSFTNALGTDNKRGNYDGEIIAFIAGNKGIVLIAAHHHDTLPEYDDIVRSIKVKSTARTAHDPEAYLARSVAELAVYLPRPIDDDIILHNLQYQQPDTLIYTYQYANISADALDEATWQQVAAETKATQMETFVNDRNSNEFINAAVTKGVTIITHFNDMNNTRIFTYSITKAEYQR